MGGPQRPDGAREGVRLTVATREWPWEWLARSNASSHELLVGLLAPAPADALLDVGTGGGGLALRAAEAGARVVGLDLSTEALAEARRAAAAAGLEITWVEGDAEALPFPEGSFDVVASAFGVNFARRHERAAAELARVCRPGGRVGLALMPAGSRAAETWTAIRRFGADGDHPGSWGTEERARAVLGDAFDLDVRVLESPPEPEPPADEAWERMRTAFGPMRRLLERLEPAQVEGVRRDLLRIRDRYAGRPRTSLVVVGTRR